MSFRQRVDEFLQAHTTLALATWTPDGPQCAALFYAHAWEEADDGDDLLLLYFISNPESNHSMALLEQPLVAAAIYQDGQNWQTIRGLQIEGSAHQAEDAAEQQAAQACYMAKYPFVEAGLKAAQGGPVELAGALARGRFYVLRADWIRLIDNSLGFGHREEVTY